MTTSQATYLRNPITDDVVKADPALSAKLRSYGWLYANSEAYRRCYAKRLTQPLLRTEVN